VVEAFALGTLWELPKLFPISFQDLRLLKTPGRSHVVEEVHGQFPRTQISGNSVQPRSHTPIEPGPRGVLGVLRVIPIARLPLRGLLDN